MTKTLLLAVTYIGVTVDSLFTSWWKGAWPILRPLPSPPLSVFCLWVISDGRLEPKSYAFFFFSFYIFFFSRFARTMNRFVILCPFFFFIYFFTLVKTKWWASKIFIVNKKKKKLLSVNEPSSLFIVHNYKRSFAPRRHFIYHHIASLFRIEC